MDKHAGHQITASQLGEDDYVVACDTCDTELVWNLTEAQVFEKFGNLVVIDNQE